jgi:hypothetical protein
MNVISKFQRSWALARICLGVLARNKKLLIFPVVTFCFWVMMIALFFTPLAIAHTGYSIWQAEHWQSIGHQFFQSTNGANGFNASLNVRFERWAYWLLMYVGAMLVGTFANVAFYHEILSALRGGPVSIQSGLNFAVSRWKSILMWSLFAGVIGLIIRMIEEKVGWIGKLVMALLGAAWSTACVFIIPVLVESDSANPVQSLKQSATILLRTWGEAVIGFAGLRVGGLIMGLSTIFVFAVAAGLAFGLKLIALAIAIVIGWMMVLFTYSYVMSVAAHVYRGALYLYASGGQLVHGFSADMMNDCWRRKKS